MPYGAGNISQTLRPMTCSRGWLMRRRPSSLTNVKRQSASKVQKVSFMLPSSPANEAMNDQFGWIARNLGDVDGDGADDHPLLRKVKPVWQV
jgi:hypothetical protein